MSEQEAAATLTLLFHFTHLIAKRTEPAFLLFLYWPPAVSVDLCSCCLPFNNIWLSGVHVPLPFPVNAVSPRHHCFFHQWLISPTVVYMWYFWGKAEGKHTGVTHYQNKVCKGAKEGRLVMRRGFPWGWNTEWRDIVGFVIILNNLLKLYKCHKNKQTQTVWSFKTVAPNLLTSDPSQ